MDSSGRYPGRPRRSRPGIAAAIGLVLVVILAGCTGGSPAPGPVAFWDALRITGADEAEGWATFGEMTSASDIVVVAEIASFELSRTFQGDAAEDLVGYGKANLKVIETLQDNPPEGLIPVEFLLGGNPKNYGATVEAIGRAVPQGRFLAFLRAKRGEGEEGLYRLVNSNGLWGQVEGTTIGAPMADPEFGMPYAAELARLASFEELLAYARAR